MVNMWQLTKLSDVAKLTSGGTPLATKKEYYENGTIPWLVIGDLTDSFVECSEKYITEIALKESNAKLLPIGTLLIAMYGSIGKLGITKIECATNQAIASIIELYGIDKFFLFYLFLYKRPFLMQLGKGGTQKNISLAVLNSLEIPLPPLAEQERIVAKIEELFAGIDAGVENLKSVKNQIALYRQSVLKSAFDGTLYKTTEWNIDVLKNLCSVISDGDHQPPPKAKNGIPFIMISNINKNLINFEDTNFVSENYYTSLSEKRKPKWGDVLYSVVGSYGIPVLIDFQKEFCFQRHIALLRPNTNKIFSKFLFYMLRSRNVYNQATDCSTGTAQKTVPLSGLREIHIPVPTLAEQERIVAEIESRFERADALETAVDRALNDAEKLKQAVLKKAFSGELVPQNLDDEPASVLLDRIRAARASELPAKKGKRKKTEVDSQL